MNLTPRQQQILDAKRTNLHNMRSTVRPDFGVLTSNSRSFQFDTPQANPQLGYPAPGAGPIVVTQFTMPTNQTGKLTAIAIVHIGAAGSFYDGSGSVLWHVFRNGAPLRGFENLYAQVGTVQQPADMSLILKQNDVIQVLVEIPLGQVAPVGNPFARLGGYYNFGGQGAQLPSGGGAPTLIAAGGGNAAGSGVSAGHFSSSGGGGGPHRPNTK